MRQDLRVRFVDFVRRKQLVKPGDRVLVAVSGGVDSMVLLDLFRHSLTELQVDLLAAHFDHAMRPNSANDARFVAATCARWAIPWFEARAQQPLHAEAQARSARYAFLGDAMTRAGAHRIATAHHADDQIETVLFRLLRGAGLRGLSGIPVRRGPIIRPLLRFRKAELEAYAALHKIEFRDDETNATERFARNRIRHGLIPAMQSVHPRASSEILRMARHAARAERGWQTQVRAARKRAVCERKNEVAALARGILLEYDAETRARVLRAELGRFGVALDRAATLRLLDFVQGAESGSRFDVGSGFRVDRAFDVFRIARDSAVDTDITAHIADCSGGTAEAVIAGRKWDVVWTTSPNTFDNAERFSCDAVAFPLEVRSWRAGDRIRMSYGTKKLKKLFAEARIPIHERAAVPIVVDAAGRVCWVVGVARSVDATPQTDAALTIMVTHAENS